MPNANYLWIGYFATALNGNGKAALVMANSASDAGKSEYEIRKKLIEEGIISQMVTLPSNMFSSVTLPATLWFFDKQKPNTDKKDKILFIDARNVFTQVDRAHRKFSDEQIKNLGIITKLYNGNTDAFAELISEYETALPTSAEKTVGIPPLEFRKVLDTYAKKRSDALRRGSFTRFVIKDHLLTLYYYEEGKFKLPEYEHIPGDHMPAGCHCGNGMLTVLPEGTVMVCRRMESSGLGNIFTDNLSEMWENAKKTYRRYDEFEICSKCKLSPWCRGCPAIAASTSGSFLGRDPQCWRVVEKLTKIFLPLINVCSSALKWLNSDV